MQKISLMQLYWRGHHSRACYRRKPQRWDIVGFWVRSIIGCHSMGDCFVPFLLIAWFLLLAFPICRHVHGKRVLIVTNTTVAPLYLDKVVDALTKGNPNVSVDSVILPDGEKYKNMVGVIQDWL